MSENIKPSEVSEVLLQQLKGIDTHLQFDEVGNVLQVSDGVALFTVCATRKPMSCWSLKTVSWLS